MPSLTRSETSRVNGAKSRGPVTDEGRRKVAFNAIRHGLTSKSVVLTNESKDRFQELFDTYLAELQPEGEIEFGLVEEMVAAKWRIRRIWGMESALLDVEMDLQAEAIDKQFKTVDQGIRLALAFDGRVKQSGSLALLSTHENRLSRAHDRAFRQLQELQAARHAAAQAAAEQAAIAEAEAEAARAAAIADTPAHPPEANSHTGPPDLEQKFSENEPEEPFLVPDFRGPGRAESPHFEDLGLQSTGARRAHPRFQRR